MIRCLGNIGIRVWLATLFCIPLGLYLLPGFLTFFPGISPALVLLSMATGFFVMIGFIMDMAAQKAVMDHIKEGQAWERAEIHNKAEKKYMKALRLYDTFLFSVFSTRKTARKILTAIARFKSNTPVKNENFRLAAAMYLKLHPGDEMIAGQWLKQLQTLEKKSPLEQDVLTLLSETYYGDQSRSLQIRNAFHKTGEKGPAKKKLSSYALKKPVFAAASWEGSQAPVAGSGETLERQKTFSHPEKKPVRQSRPVRKIAVGKYIRIVSEKAVVFIHGLIQIMGSGLSLLLLSVYRICGWIMDHKRARFCLKAGSIGVVSMGLVFFIFSTVSHMFKSTPDEKPIEKIEISVSKPFTIQVSAYLKKQFADNYVNTLKKKGIEATVKQVDGGGKTWYVVRVSEFADKKNAEAYGQQLKKQKIIDDFFVNNK